MHRIVMYQLFAAISITVSVGIVNGCEWLGTPDIIAFPVALAAAIGLFVLCVRNIRIPDSGSNLPRVTRFRYFGTGVTPQSEAYERALAEASRSEGWTHVKRRPSQRRKRRDYRA